MIFRPLVAAMLFAISSITVAETLGTHGNLYDIQEEDAVGYIKRRMSQWQQDGTMKQKQEEAKARVRETMLHPKPIPGISTAVENKTFYWDPSMVTDKPITDAKGRIIFPVGTKVNPLAYVGLSKRLIFIDARDSTQIEFAVSGKRIHSTDKIILTGGSWVALSKRLNEQVFYDQSGYLTRRFGITHVPAVVQQEGLKLKIEEKAL